MLIAKSKPTTTALTPQTPWRQGHEDGRLSRAYRPHQYRGEARRAYVEGFAYGAETACLEAQLENWGNLSL